MRPHALNSIIYVATCRQSEAIFLYIYIHTRALYINETSMYCGECCSNRTTARFQTDERELNTPSLVVWTVWWSVSVSLCVCARSTLATLRNAHRCMYCICAAEALANQYIITWAAERRPTKGKTYMTFEAPLPPLRIEAVAHLFLLFCIFLFIFFSGTPNFVDFGWSTMASEFIHVRVRLRSMQQRPQHHTPAKNTLHVFINSSLSLQAFCLLFACFLLALFI